MKPYPGFRVLSEEELEASLDWDTGLPDDGAPPLAEVAGATDSTRHLPGKHDQKSHGKGGGTGMPSSLTREEFAESLAGFDGWESGGATGHLAVYKYPDGKYLQVSTHLYDSSAAEQRAGMIRALSVIDPIVKAEGVQHLDRVEIVSSRVLQGDGGETGLQTNGVISTRVNGDLLDPSSAASDLFRESTDLGFYGPYAKNTPAFERVVAHELGHAVGYQDLPGSRMAAQVAADTSASGYASFHPDEFYAEGYADWATRDRDVDLTDGSDARLAEAGVRRFAYTLATTEGWEGTP
jgi:hypothetical protein